jgi:biotin carboxyl carrier protein
MTFKVLIEGEEYTVEEPADKSTVAAAFVINKAAVELDIAQIDERTFSVLNAGRSWLVRISRTPQGIEITCGGRHVIAQVLDRRHLIHRRASAHAGRVKVVCPMFGRVVRLNVETGSHVEAGEAIAVIEAMKMQNELRSPKAGTVASIRFQPGESVSAGDAIAEIE